MFFDYLRDILPFNRILVSSAIGAASFIIVTAGGLSSDFVSGATVLSRAIYAFACTAAVTFCLLMCCEEYAIFTTKRKLEHFIDDAPLEEADNFNRNEYLGIDDTQEPATDDSFQPVNFDDALPNS